MEKMYLDTSDVSEILDVSKSTAQRRIRQMNEELVEQGYYAERGKIPIELFYEKYPYISKDAVRRIEV